MVIQESAKGDKGKYLQLAQINAKAALATQLKQSSRMHERYQAFVNCSIYLKLNVWNVLILAIRWNQTVASCVVFNQEGPLKSDYRRFNIEGITGFDD